MNLLFSFLFHSLLNHISITAACSDALKHVDCAFHCLTPDLSASFYPELSHLHFNNSQIAASMSNMASTTDTNSPTNQGLKSLRILCFGDSLTAGYSGYGYFHYPYATHIRKKLKEELPDTDAVVDVSGLSGDRVIAGQFLERIKAVSEKAKHTPYDWIIILGGTNDLAWSERPDNIYESLKQVWTVALDSGANVLALNVLEGEHTSGDIVPRRKQLNALIAGHEEHRLYYMDLCAAVPFFTMNDTMRAMMWDDGLHLTMDGYEMMGNAIAVKLLELLQVAKDPLNTGPKKSPKSHDSQGTKGDD